MNPPMAWIPNGAKPFGMRRSRKPPSRRTLWNRELNTSTVPSWKFDAVNGGHARVVVGHPQRRGRTERQAPRVHQVGVNDLRALIAEVGDQVHLAELVAVAGRRPSRADGRRGGGGACGGWTWKLGSWVWPSRYRSSSIALIPR